MFNGRGYNLSDIAAVTRGGGNDGMWGGDGAWWLILLFLFAGWGNGGYGNNFGGGNVRDAVSYGFDINNLENGIRGLEHGLCDGFYDMNTSLLTGFGNNFIVVYFKVAGYVYSQVIYLPGFYHNYALPFVGISGYLNSTYPDVNVGFMISYVYKRSNYEFTIQAVKSDTNLTLNTFKIYSIS